MKLTGLLFALIPATLFGQITVTQSDFASAGDTVRMSTTTDPQIDYTSTGANHTWDFSMLTPEDQKVNEYNGMSGASFLVQAVFGPFAPPSYQASFFTASDALPLDQLGQFLPVNISDVFQFSKSTTDSITSIGYAVSVEGTEVPFKSDTIETRYKFPLDYQDVYYSHGYSNMDMNPVYNGIWIQYTTRDVEVDGWGAITTPYGTFDALRVRHDITEDDSLFMEVFGQGTWIPLPIPDRHLYEWWTNGEKEPILRITTTEVLGAETVTGIEYRDINRNLSASVPELEFAVEIYPNPVTESLTLRGDFENGATYVIVNQTGELVQQGVVNTNDVINASAWSAGTYTLVILNNGALSQSTFIKK